MGPAGQAMNCSFVSNKGGTSWFTTPQSHDKAGLDACAPLHPLCPHTLKGPLLKTRCGGALPGGRQAAAFRAMRAAHALSSSLSKAFASAGLVYKGALEQGGAPRSLRLLAPTFRNLGS